MSKKWSIFCSSIVGAFLLASLAWALPAPNASSALILRPTVGSPFSGYTCEGSLEYAKAITTGFTPVCVDTATWGAMPAVDMATYRQVVLGDATCTSLGAVAAAEANRILWSPVIGGNMILVGTDPAYHSSFGFGGAQGGDELTEGAIKFAGDEPNETGAYISLSCYYHGVIPGTPVDVLDKFGSFTVTGVGCYNNAHIVAVHPALSGITDTTLSSWSCSVHEAFDSFPSSFLPLAIAKGIGGPGSLTFADGSFGIPYILARGKKLSPVACGNGILEAPEECDDGNTTNGDGCSAQCKIEIPVCGNGLLETGEECDDGNTANGDGCSAICEIENKAPDCSAAVANPSLLWPPDHSMVPVSILGVTDPDGDPISILAVSVFQDEPVLGAGSGDFSPDAQLSPLMVRVERRGTPPKNGRVYHIGFIADDGSGGTCTDEVMVCVPHDQSVSSVCVDEGPLYDSLIP